MELSTELDGDRKIFILHIAGAYRRPQDAFEAQRYVVRSSTEHGCRRVLLDLTHAEIMAGTIPTFETATSQPDLIGELRKLKFAAVYSRLTEDERFFENTAVNRGVQVRVFDDRAEAVEWLLQD